MGVSVHGLLRQGKRIAGVTTSAGERRARLVIDADGRDSRTPAGPGRAGHGVGVLGPLDGIRR
jgi:hypothetical protein